MANEPTDATMDEITYKVVNSEQLDDSLKTIADAIRAKGGATVQLEFPNGMAAAITDIETGGGIDYFQYATSCNQLFSYADIPDNLSLNLPNTTDLQYMFNESAGGNTIELTLGKPVTDMAYFMGHQSSDERSTVTKLTIIGDLSSVTRYTRFARYCNSLIEIDADIDFRNVTNAYYLGFMFYTSHVTPLKISFVPNTLSLDVSTQIINSRILDDSSLISFCNCLKARNGTVTLSSENKQRCASVLGTVYERTDDTGTYEFFTADANGTTTLEYFVTQIKGWTIA